MKIARALPVFTTAFILIYMVAMYWNLALVSYFPRLGQWHALTVTDLPRSAGPGMYWYGWLATSFLGAAIVAALALALPANAIARGVRGAATIVPVAAVVMFVFLLRGWFLH